MIFLATLVVGCVVVSGYTATEEDIEYMKWSMDTFESEIYGDKISSAYERRDYDVMELYAGLRYDYHNKKLSEIDQFSVSSELEPIKNEFKLYLQDMIKADYYFERGAKYIDTDDFQTGSDYIDSAQIHLDNCEILVDKYSAGLSEVTPTPTPRVEKDSDDDGVPDEFDYAPNDPDVQTKDDVTTSGVGAIFVICSLLVGYFVKKKVVG